MLDIIGAMALTTLAVILAGSLILAGTRDGAARLRLALGAVIWFATVAALAASGVFSVPGRGTMAIGAVVVLPILLGVTAVARSRTAREFVWSIPLALLVGVHTGRLLGLFFLVLHSAGRLPPTFAHAAGWGDIVVSIAALPLAWAIHRRARGWQGLTAAWNTIALLDLVTAVSLGVGSAPGSPVRFIFEDNSGAIATLPWAMIPGFIVPIYMLTHLAVFARLAAGATADERVPLRSAA